MAGQEMQLTITGKDQASDVIKAVNKRVGEFGRDVGRSIVAMVGPMALATMAISKITDHLETMKQKAKEAFDWGAGLTDSANKLEVSAEELQKINRAANVTGESVDRVGQAFKLAADLITRAKAGNADAIASLSALGISVEDLGSTKPEDVLAKLAGALAAAADPADKMAISMAALGKSAKDLQDVLSKGFDIKGAFGAQEGDLTNEAARYLNEVARKKREDELREMSKSARKQATESFLNEDPEGKAIRDKIISDRLRQQQQGGATGTGIVTASQLANDPKIQAQIQGILAEREKAKAAADAAKAASEEAKAAADALRKKAEADKAKEEAEKNKDKDKDKDKKKPEGEPKEPKGSKIGGASNGEIGSISVKTPPITVSSLREIGGGMAGERIGNQLDLAQVQVNISERMLQELEKINSRSGDFTKPPAALGLTPGRMIA